MGNRLPYTIQHAWTPFKGRNAEEPPQVPIGADVSYGFRPDRVRSHGFNHKRIIAPIVSQIAIDASGIELRHVMLNENESYIDEIDSGLNECLRTDPNLDQGPTMFRQDIVTTMLDEGVVAIVPVETDVNPDSTGGYDIRQMRVGLIKQWRAQHVQVDLYDQINGRRMDVWVEKRNVAIVENPLYSIMNEPNSTLQRLITKLNQLDVTDDRLASGKLDIILQLPYTIKHEARLKEAKKRIGDVEEQLVNSRHGIGFIDSTERITQLNRPAENNLLKQVETLELRLYTQLGLTEEIFFGTAEEPAMLNYHNRTVAPIVRAIQEEMRRKFLTKNARTRRHSIKYFRDPFSLVPVSQIAEIADKFTRNEIMSPNEIRPIVGLRPVDDPKADELRNRNMPEMPDVEKEEEEEKPEPLKPTKKPSEGKKA